MNVSGATTEVETLRKALSEAKGKASKERMERVGDITVGCKPSYLGRVNFISSSRSDKAQRGG